MRIQHRLPNAAPCCYLAATLQFIKWLGVQLVTPTTETLRGPQRHPCFQPAVAIWQ
jgi:hypothetical protein